MATICTQLPMKETHAPNQNRRKSRFARMANADRRLVVSFSAFSAVAVMAFLISGRGAALPIIIPATVWPRLWLPERPESARATEVAGNERHRVSFGDWEAAGLQAVEGTVAPASVVVDPAAMVCVRMARACLTVKFWRSSCQ